MDLQAFPEMPHLPLPEMRVRTQIHLHGRTVREKKKEKKRKKEKKEKKEKKKMDFVLRGEAALATTKLCLH